MVGTSNDAKNSDPKNGDAKSSNSKAKSSVVSQLLFFAVAVVVGVAAYFGIRQLIYSGMLQAEQAKSTAPIEPKIVTEPLLFED